MKQIFDPKSDAFYEVINEHDNLYDLKSSYKNADFDKDVRVRAMRLQKNNELKIQDKISQTVVNFSTDLNGKIDKEKLKRCLIYLLIANCVGGVSLKEALFEEKIKILKQDFFRQEQDPKFSYEFINLLDFKEAKSFSVYFQSRMNQGEILLKTGREKSPDVKVKLDVGFRTKRVPIKLTEKIFDDNFRRENAESNFIQKATRILASSR